MSRKRKMSKLLSFLIMATTTVVAPLSFSASCSNQEHKEHLNIGIVNGKQPTNAKPPTNETNETNEKQPVVNPPSHTTPKPSHEIGVGSIPGVAIPVETANEAKKVGIIFRKVEKNYAQIIFSKSPNADIFDQTLFKVIKNRILDFIATANPIGFIELKCLDKPNKVLRLTSKVDEVPKQGVKQWILNQIYSLYLRGVPNSSFWYKTFNS